MDSRFFSYLPISEIPHVGDVGKLWITEDSYPYQDLPRPTTVARAAKRAMVRI